MGIWFCFNGVSIIIGGLLSYGIGRIHANNLAPWKWLFIVIGLISLIWSIVLFFCLPDSQITASFLTEDEKRDAIEMVRENNTGIHSKVFKGSQVKEALLDVKTWVFFWLAFLFNIPNSIATVRTPPVDCLKANLVRPVWQLGHFKFRLLLSKHNSSKRFTCYDIAI